MTELSTIHKLSQIVEEGTKEAKEILNRPLESIKLERTTIIPNSINKKTLSEYTWTNRFYEGDNLLIIEKLLKEGYKGKLDLIYIDPPFLTNANYKGRILVKNGEEKEVIEYFAYRDIWKNGLIGYLEMLYIRLYLMKELLSEKGTIYVHLDYRTVHYVKILMDQIFGEDNFLNEVIWAYKSGGVSKRYYSRKHDNILVYSKGKEYIFNPQLEKSYNRGFKPYRFKNVEEFEDDIGWYTLINLRDVWQIDMVGRTSKERVGYDTQKPEKLLKRIILTSSDKDSIVADFFAGSGTTGIVAEKFNRKWIMVDKGALSSITINKRLIENHGAPFYNYKLSNNTERIGELFIKNMEIVKDKKGIGDLIIELDRYELRLNEIIIKDKYREKVLEILTKDSLALIDFIGIDIDYNGYNPIISWQYYRNNNNLYIGSNIKIEGIKFKDNHKIYIKYVDIFGHENSIIYEINK